jgi:3-dehydroquinate synthase
MIVDARFFHYLEDHASDILARNSETVTHLVLRSCRIKASVVSRDEKESGLRSTLNFGHTLGHAIETAAGYKSLLHGEAVSMGMAYAARLAHHLQLCNRSVVEALDTLLVRLGLPVEIPDFPFRNLHEALQRDKKVARERIRFILPIRIGQVRIQEVSDKKVLKDSLHRC